MDIISALFTEGFDLRPAAGGSTRIDLTGVMFSVSAPNEPPATVSPHLVVLVRCRPGESGQGVLEVEFKDEKGAQVARNAQPFGVEPGKFTYRLVKAELTFDTYGTIEAHCSVDGGTPTVVPLTLLPPAA